MIEIVVRGATRIRPPQSPVVSVQPSIQIIILVTIPALTLPSAEPNILVHIIHPSFGDAIALQLVYFEIRASVDDCEGTCMINTLSAYPFIDKFRVPIFPWW